MNKRRDLPPPIIFSLKYMDQTPAINNLVKSCYRKLQTSSGNQSGIVVDDLLLMITSCLYACVVGSASVCLSVRCE